MRSALTLVLLTAVAAACGGGELDARELAPATAGGAGGAAGRAGRGGVGGKGGSKAGTGGAPGGAAGSGGAPGGATGTGGGREVRGGDCPPIGDVENLAIDETWGQWAGFNCDAQVLYAPLDKTFPKLKWGPCPKQLAEVPDCEKLEWFGFPLYGRMWSAAGDKPVVYGSAALLDPPVPLMGAHAVVTVDGEVLRAFLPAYKPAVPGELHWGYSPDWLGDGVWQLGISPTGPCGGGSSGLLAMRMEDQYPKVTLHVPCAGDTNSNWAVSPKHIFRMQGPIERYTWDGEGPFPVYTPAMDPDGLPAYFRDTLGDTLFLKVNSGGKAGVLAWTEEDGLRPVLRWPGTFEHFAVRFGTDGTDMVWVEGVGKQKSTYIAEKMTLMTAPYSLDAATLEATKREIGPDPIQSGGGTFPVAVGCGHAATLFVTPAGPTQSVGLLIVRLSDGMRWTVKGNVPAYPINGVGVTCDYVYAVIIGRGLIRVPIASLPPGGSPP